MNNRTELVVFRNVVVLIALAALGGCASTHSSNASSDPRSAGALVGAWRSRVQFASGAFASVKDLEFLYVFNDGGTMTESSNYDGAPPVPPAYGIWRQTGPREFEAKYLFYATKPPAKFDEISSGGGWAPAGHGELVEHITLAPDGQSFTSSIEYASFGAADKSAEGGGAATGMGRRVKF
jgi:hypothetical protein